MTSTCSNAPTSTLALSGLTLNGLHKYTQRLLSLYLMNTTCTQWKIWAALLIPHASYVTIRQVVLQKKFI